MTAIAIALAACASAPAPEADVAAQGAPACALSQADQAWVTRALAALRFSSREITGFQFPDGLHVVFFDARCVVSSDDALSANVHWSATPHQGSVSIPNGDVIPAGVVSFSGAGDNHPYFVMSTPSVWRAGGVPPRQMGLETLMVFVVIHESSHVAQSPTYGQRISEIAVRNGLPEGFNDDSMQEQFSGDAAFSQSVAQETELFFQAAAAADSATALRLARQARGLMRVRADRAFVGERAYFMQIEGLFLTFEAAGQWAGYKWLTNPRGGGEADTPELRASMRGNWWSQNEGLGIALTLDRLGFDWHGDAFGAGRQTIVEMLDTALVEN